MVGVLAAQVVDVQGHAGMIDQAMEKFAEQIDVEATDHRAREIDVHFQPRTTGQIDHDARQGFIERHIAVTVASQPLLVAPGLGQCLTEGNSQILNGVMRVDVQIAVGDDIEIDQAMPGNLIKHVVEERNTGGKFALASTIEIETHGNLRLQGVARNFDLPHEGWLQNVESEGHDTISPYFYAFRENPMSRFWSQVVRDLTPYVPGEQPKISNLIKLNTNENPYPPSPKALAAIQAELGADAARLRLYPDPNADLLKAAIARQHSVSPAEVFVGNGSDEVLAHIFMALLKHDAPLLFPDITYSFYPVYCGLYGVEYRTVPLADDFSINAADFCGQPAKTGKIGGIIFPNPNAPTGRLLPLAAIEQILRANPDVVVVVDEAYVDFGGESAIRLVKDFDNLLVVHTLSKSRSLAGLRVGFAVGHPDLIEALERVKNSFNSYPLDRLAIAGAVAALEDQAHFTACCQKVIATRDQLTSDLSQLGFEVLPSAANFIFTRHPQRDAAELAQALRARNIIVRHFKQPRIEQFLRITIGTDGECGALVAALKEILG